MFRRNLSFNNQYQTLLLGVVLCVTIFSDHLALGFSSRDIICSSSSSYSLGRSPICGAKFCWYAVDVDREETVSTVYREEEVPVAATTTDSRRRRRPSVAAIANFEERFQELLEFREIHGHTRVPRREGRLGVWVNKLRQRRDRLDERRLDRLNEIGFCWDATNDKRKKERYQWWKKLESFRKIQQQEQQQHQMVAGTENITPTDAVSSRSRLQQQSSLLSFDNLSSSQKDWLRRQRIEFINSNHEPSQKLEKEQIQALYEIDPNWWQTVSKYHTPFYWY